MRIFLKIFEYVVLVFGLGLAMVYWLDENQPQEAVQATVDQVKPGDHTKAVRHEQGLYNPSYVAVIYGGMVFFIGIVIFWPELTSLVKEKNNGH